EKFDIVINGTSASLSGDLPPLPANLLSPNACCYDLMYGAEPTVFLKWALENGAAKIADGLGMLIGQAAEAFYVWRHIRPEVVPVITAMRRQLNEKK
ncbi:MAG: shikimate dehydrogenase, partial [Moraxellaceae bacterium]